MGIMTKQTYEDYKYVMLDTAFLYLGAKYSYGELLDNQDVPFKLRTIVERYILPDMDADTTLESHFYYMKEKDFSCRTYLQLKAKVKCNVLTEKKGLLGKRGTRYATKVFPLAELVKMPPQEKERQGLFVQEIILNKLAMMTFNI